MDQKTWREIENRCIQEEPPACMARCPIHVDVRGFLKEASAGRWDQAYWVLAATMPFPGILARICDHPCEQACRRGPAGGSVSVGDLERAVVKRGRISRRRLLVPQKDRRVAVVGSGLSSLTVALDLARKGYLVTIFEQGKRLGGPLWLLPEHLLPRQIIKEETSILADLGVTIHLSREIDGDSWLKAAMTEYDAVYVGMDSGVESLPQFPSDAMAQDSLLSPAPLSRPFTGGEPSRESGSSPISAVAEGRRAAVSIDRYLQDVSMTAGREREGPYETRLYTNLEGVTPREAVPMENPELGYSDEEAREEAGRCIQCECMECVRNCVVLKSFKGHPKKYVRQISNDATIVMGGHGATRSLVNSCSLCGLCAEVCPTDLSMASVCMEGRKSLVDRGKMPASAHQFALEDMASASGEKAGLALREPGKETSRFVFFPGCQLSGIYPEHVLSTYSLLRENLEGGTGLMLRCCGVPAKWAAREDLFEDAIRSVRQDWESLGRPMMIVACPTCYRTFKENLPEAEIVPLWQTLLEIQERSGSGRMPLTPRLAVHDPCTARHEPVMQDSIRSFLKRLGCSLDELPLSGKETECCGFGGLMSTANPSLAKETAKQRALRSESDYVTYCAMCRNVLAAEGKRVFHALDLLFSGPETDPAARPACGWSERRENRYRLRVTLLGGVAGRDRKAMEDHESIALHLSDEVFGYMEERRILREDAQRVIHHAEKGLNRFVNPETGRSLASFKPGHVTYWVEYSREGSGFRVHDVYYHRMEIVDAGGVRGEG